MCTYPLSCLLRTLARRPKFNLPTSCSGRTRVAPVSDQVSFSSMASSHPKSLPPVAIPLRLVSPGTLAPLGPAPLTCDWQQNWMFSSKVPRPLPLSDSRTRTGTNAPQPDVGPTPTHFGQWNCYGPEPAQHGPRAPSWEPYAPGRSFNKEVEQNRIGATPRMGKARSGWNFKARARLEEGEWERVQCR